VTADKPELAEHGCRGWGPGKDQAKAKAKDKAEDMPGSEHGSRIRSGGRGQAGASRG
jgi:hypothetical protein